MSINEKDKTDTLLKLYEIQWERYDQVRSFEWKITLGFWTAIGFFTYTVFNNPKMETIQSIYLIIGEPIINIAIPCIPISISILEIIYAGLSIVYIFGWQVGGYRANVRNKNYALRYLDNIEDSINIVVERKKHETDVKFWEAMEGCFTNWSRYSQILVTTTLLIGSYWLLSNKISIILGITVLVLLILWLFFTIGKKYKWCKCIHKS